MKKIFTTLLIVLCFYGLASAQQKNNVEFGFQFGYNTSYVTESGTGQHTDPIGGLNAGFSADYYFSDSWSIKAMAVYDQKGWGNGFIIAQDGSEVDGTNYNLNYVTIPVMANWHFGRQRNWYLDFGPYVGILTGANADSYDVTNSFNSTDIGFRLDIGVKFPITDRTKFFIQYGGEGGATNIFKATADGATVQNVTGNLDIGINF